METMLKVMESTGRVLWVAFCKALYVVVVAVIFIAVFAYALAKGAFGALVAGAGGGRKVTVDW